SCYCSLFDLLSFPIRRSSDLVWLTFSGLSGWSVGAGLLFTLFITHALVGAVELGTDGWIQNITGSILTPSQGTTLFIFTSAIMLDRKSTRLNSSHGSISYAVF